MSVYEKLHEIQINLNVPKNQYNSFGKYNYRSCEDILQALKPLLASTRTVLHITDTVVCVGDKNYIQANITLFDIDSGESVNVSAVAREAENKKGMDDSQISGATSSYSRKYALNGLFALDDARDSDATNKHGKDELPELTPDHKRWADAVAAYKRDGNINKVKQVFFVSEENEKKIAELAKN